MAFEIWDALCSDFGLSEPFLEIGILARKVLYGRFRALQSREVGLLGGEEFGEGIDILFDFQDERFSTLSVGEAGPRFGDRVCLSGLLEFFAHLFELVVFFRGRVFRVKLLADHKEEKKEGCGAEHDPDDEVLV